MSDELGVMSDERDRVLGSVKEALAGLGERAVLPDYEDGILVSSGYETDGGSGWQVFTEKFSAVSGRAMTRLDEVVEFLQQDGHDSGYCDPDLKEKVGQYLEKAGLRVSYEFHRKHINEHAFGITRASGVVAESGTVILNDEDTVDRLAALTPWVHVAVMDGAPIFGTIPEAIGKLGDSSNVIWVTGPSKTADIEGILIEGVHGPGVQICLKLD
jgi:L-lactate dehydrogenase complex protein LldG